MKNIILGLMFLSAAPSFGAESCRPGYSAGYLNLIKNDAIDATIAEARGAGLFYILQIEISKIRNPQKRSASTTVYVSVAAPASTANNQWLTGISAAVQSKRVSALCVRVNPNYYNHNVTLPAQFSFNYRDELPYELDLVKPILR